MNKLQKKLTALTTMSMVAAMAAMNAFAAETTLSDSWKNLGIAIENLVKGIMTPISTILLALGAVYCVILGVKYAVADEPQEREKAKSHLKNAIVGYILIFVLIVALYLVTPGLRSWVNSNAGTIFN